MHVLSNAAAQALQLGSQHVARHRNEHAVLFIIRARSILRFQLRIRQLVDVDA
jgi:hypothetical protein